MIELTMMILMVLFVVIAARPKKRRHYDIQSNQCNNKTKSSLQFYDVVWKRFYAKL